MNNKSIIIYFVILFLLVILLPIIGFDISGNMIVAVLFLWLSIIAIINGSKIIIYLFKKKKYIFAIGGIAVIIYTYAFILGIVLFFLGTPFQNAYNVEKVVVVDSTWNSVKIDFTKYNHGDNKTLTIKKPFFIGVKPGDVIEVRFPSNNPAKMHYVINADYGLKMLSTSVITVGILFIVLFVFITIYFIKSKIRKE